MKVEAELPAKISCDDYHEFSYLRDQFRQVIPKIKIKEIGFKIKDIDCNGEYLGIAYVGALTDTENALMVQAIKKECGE